MTANSQLRGHPIEWDYLRGECVYSDTGDSTAATWRVRLCGLCGKRCTPEGHDACLGTLPGVMNACCGHGHDPEAYVQFPNGTDIRGRDALVEIERLKAGREYEKPAS